MVSRTDADGATIAYTYDLAGDRTSVTTTLPGQTAKTTRYSFDVRNRLASVIDPSGGTTSYTYDADSNLTRTVMANGVVETRSYDALNRLTDVVNQDATGTTISSFHYTLDKAGNRTQVKEASGRQVDYTYDDLYRLTEEKVTDSANGNRTDDYAYDEVGNRLTKTETIAAGITTTAYEYDGNDRLLDEKVNGQLSTIYIYDNNGNTLTKKDATGETDYVWNQEKRLIGAMVKDAQGQTQQQLQYRYNDAGIRTASTVNGQETRYLLDEVQPYTEVLEEYVMSGTKGVSQVSYVYGNRLISQTQSGATAYYLVDGLGSTTELTDASGTVVSRSRYDAFGNGVKSEGAISNKYQFAGEQFDLSLGDYYLRQRFYDTRTGRFTRGDSWEGQRSEPITLHKYIYSNANPIIYVDPSGYVSLNQGKQVHDKIEQHFVSQDPTGRDKEQTIRKILLRSKGYYSPRRPFNRLTPDLVDFSQRDIYEIKTTKELLLGIGKMYLYLDVLNRQDPFWHPGSDYVPPFVIPMTGIYTGNIAIVKPPILGVISYDIIETQKLFLATAVLGVNSIQQAISNLLSTLALTRGFI